MHHKKKKKKNSGLKSQPDLRQYFVTNIELAPCRKGNLNFVCLSTLTTLCKEISKNVDRTRATENW